MKIGNLVHEILLLLRDVSTGATSATIAPPKFSDN